MRGNFTLLGFYLDIPSQWRAACETARERGLLMDRMEKLKY